MHSYFTFAYVNLHFKFIPQIPYNFFAFLRAKAATAFSAS